MAITKTLHSFYEEFEGDNEVRRMLLTDLINHDIFQKHFILLNIRKGMQIIDFGCGPGVTTRDLARHSDPGLVIGIDMKESAIEAARVISNTLEVNNVRFARMNATKVSSPDDRFDLTFARNLLMHVPSPKRVLKEMVRVTKPGGTVAVVSTDGFMTNLYPLTPELKEHVDFVKQNGLGKMFLGRELYSKFVQLKLEDIRVQVDTKACYGKASPEEVEYWTLMYEQMEPIADVLFKSREAFEKNKKIWFEFLNNEERFDYFQIILVVGRKP